MLRIVFKPLLLLAILVSPLGTWAQDDCDAYFRRQGLSSTPFVSVERRFAVASQLARLYDQRTLEQHLELDQRITAKHAQNEMSFQVKNPKTGFYDKFVEVPVNSRVATMSETSWQELVKSTGPVMRALRHLLQKIYSGVPLDSANLGIGHLPQDKQELVIQVIKESIYFEPALVHRNMADYPFLSVGGFDGAIGDPDNPEPVFFEMNLGTPSGLSNNALLLSELRRLDPSMSYLISPYQIPDDTFLRLRHAIEDNALSWTGVYGGLSVVVSPGIYNGAHPDVAEIAKHTGMPLVEPSDLYIDDLGYVRLNAGPGRDHPVVTGIYGRMEESYFLQSSARDVPLISPNFVETNRRLNQERGYQLRLGAIYKYIRDDAGKVLDVLKDRSGKPILEEIWSQIGANPNGLLNSGHVGKDFISAIHDRKLYYSALGGRIVDDKRLFATASRYLAKSHGQKVAGPVSSLDRSEFHKLYEDPDRYVVKEPGNSGGEGIVFLSQLSSWKKRQLLKKVRRNPEAYEVQELRSPTTLTRTHQSSKGQLANFEVATDLRIFVMMDAQGEVSAGPNSLLLRTAKPESLLSNTSKGGGYGVMAILREQPGESVSPKTDPPQMVTSMNQSLKFSESLHEVWRLLRDGFNHRHQIGTPGDLKVLQEGALSLSFLLREVLDHLPLEARIIMTQLRTFAALVSVTETDLVELDKNLSQFFRQMNRSQLQLTPRLQEIWKDFFAAHVYVLKIDHFFGNSDAIYRELRDKISLKYLSSPERFYMSKYGDLLTEHFDVARITGFKDQRMQELLEEVHAGGGEIRLAIGKTKTKGQQSTYEKLSPGFWVNYSQPELSSYLKPIIDIDPFAPRAYAALVHEMEHFRDWKRHFDYLVSEGLSPEAAAKEAQKLADHESALLESERRAVNAEIAAEKNVNDTIFNRRRVEERPKEFWEFEIVNRRIYPEFESLRRVLLRSVKGEAQPGDQERSLELMRTQIEFAFQEKTRAMEYLRSNPGEESDRQLHLWSQATLIDLLMLPFGVERLLSDGTLVPYILLYRNVLETLGFSDDFGQSRVNGILLGDSDVSLSLQPSGSQQQ